MTESPLRLHGASPAELQARIAAERDQVPFLLYRDKSGAQRIRALGESGPAQGLSQPTAVAADQLTAADLSETQRRVLAALCRPFKDPSGFATPATNKQIAAEVFLSVDAVKTHLRALFGKFGVEHLPQNQKRLRLVERAFQTGLVSEREL